jgi:hypothetical protein
MFFEQHMIRMRWENLSTEERQQMAAMAGNLLQESANPNEQWSFKNRVAGLMAEVSYSVNIGSLQGSLHFRVAGSRCA